jgi:hypothetical protein
MTSALLAEDPDARVIPYCLSAGTDAKSFSLLGVRCFGFTPLRLPQIWTFPECFMVSMSAFLSKGCVSVPVSSMGFLTAVST